MKYDRFLTDTRFSGWLSMQGLDTWHIATYEDRAVILLYRQNHSYGIALEAWDRLQKHGYDIITHIDGLPDTEYEVIPENNTISKLLNGDDFKEIGLKVAKEFDATFNR